MLADRMFRYKSRPARRPMSDPPAIVARQEIRERGQAMTVIDLRKYWESRQRSGWEKSETEQNRAIEEIRGALDQWTPLIEEVIAAEKAHARLPRCEGPRCSERT